MTDSDNEPAYTWRHWAKAQPRDGYPKRIHLLEHHLADVGACMEALLAQPAIRRGLASSAGFDDVDDATSARLGVFAALYDIGKSNVGFQSRCTIHHAANSQQPPRVPCAGRSARRAVAAAGGRGY